MLQMPWKPHSTEPFLVRVTCEAEDICDDAMTEGYMTKSIGTTIASPETRWEDGIRRSMKVVPAGAWTSRSRHRC